MSARCRDLFNLDTLLILWKHNKMTSLDIEKTWEFHWGNTKEGTYIHYNGANVFDIINTILDDHEVEDCNAEIYLNLSTGQFSKPFEYSNEDHQKEAQSYHNHNMKHIICVFEN